MNFIGHLMFTIEYLLIRKALVINNFPLVEAVC
jgi:hypothetical protein